MSIFLRRCMFFSCAVFLIFSEIFILESYAAPAPPLGYSTGGLFADYFKNAVNNDCLIQEGYTVRGFLSGNDYMKPDCVVGLWQSNGIDTSWSKRQFNGIGIANPLYTLDVAGTVRFDLPGASSSGQILMGDASGALSWAPIPATCIPGGTGKGNICQGVNALSGNTTGTNNIGFGSGALFLNTTGYRNIGLGQSTLYANNNGASNIGIGYQAIYSNTGGSKNTAIGEFTLQYYTGSNAVAIGYAAANKTLGIDNTAIGYYSAYSNTTGAYNTSIGRSSMYSNINGSYNVAIGNNALYDNQSNANVAIGSSALRRVIDGGNVGVGVNSAYYLTSGLYNTLVGSYVAQSFNTGSYNIFYGYKAGGNFASGSYNIAIGQNTSLPSSTGSSQLNIGNWIYGINGNIGIGKNNPKYKLDINGNSNFYYTVIHDFGIEVGSGRTGNRYSYIDFHGDDSPANVNYGLRLMRGNTGLNAGSWLTNMGTGTLSIQQAGAGNISLDTNGYSRLLIGSGGNIGINTSTPIAKLHVNGNSILSKSLFGDGQIELSSEKTGNRQNYIDFHSDDVNPDYGFRIARWSGVDGWVGIENKGAGYISMQTQSGGFAFTANGARRMTILPDGNVGIGYSSPTQKLAVNGTSYFSDLATFNNGFSTSKKVKLGNVDFYNSGNPVILALQKTSTSHSGYIVMEDDTLSLRINDTSKPGLVLNTNGNIGIGRWDPSAKLDIVGNIRITDGTEGAGKVLMSDSQGKASWQVLPDNPSDNGFSVFQTIPNLYPKLADGRTPWWETYSTNGYYRQYCDGSLNFRVIDHESGDWPAVGKEYLFGPNDINQKKLVYNGNNNLLEISVGGFLGANNRIYVTAISSSYADYSSSAGGVQMSVSCVQDDISQVANILKNKIVQCTRCRYDCSGTNYNDDAGVEGKEYRFSSDGMSFTKQAWIKDYHNNSLSSAGYYYGETCDSDGNCSGGTYELYCSQSANNPDCGTTRNSYSIRSLSILRDGGGNITGVRDMGTGDMFSSSCTIVNNLTIPANSSNMSRFHPQPIIPASGIVIQRD